MKSTKTIASASHICYIITKFSLGFIIIGQTAKGICAIYFGNKPEILLQNLSKKFPTFTLVEDASTMKELSQLIIDYVDKGTVIPNIQLDLHGTNFQKKVWIELCNIAKGSTNTYTMIANKLGMSKGYRAVANACAANNIALLIPCHRVLRSDGNLAGYRWGVERKLELLRRERAP